MATDDETPRPKRTWEIGADLYRFSQVDLAEYRAALQAEIARIDAEVERKRHAAGGAEALFRR